MTSIVDPVIPIGIIREQIRLHRRAPRRVGTLEDAPKFIVDDTLAGTTLLCLAVPGVPFREVSGFHVDCAEQGARTKVSWLEKMRLRAETKRLIPLAEIAHHSASSRAQRGLDLRVPQFGQW